MGVQPCACCLLPALAASVVSSPCLLPLCVHSLKVTTRLDRYAVGVMIESGAMLLLFVNVSFSLSLSLSLSLYLILNVLLLPLRHTFCDVLLCVDVWLYAAS